MGEETKGILKSFPTPSRPLCNPLQLSVIFGEEGDNFIRLSIIERANDDGIGFKEWHSLTFSVDPFHLKKKWMTLAF